MLKKYSLSIWALIFVVAPFVAHADTHTLVSDADTYEKARVISVTDQHVTSVPGTNTTSTVQTLTITVLDGIDAGKTVTFKNDYTQLSMGDVFYVRHITNSIDSTDFWSVSDPYRLNVLAGLAIVFVLLAVVFGGIQGVRGLASLFGSFALIFYVLIPGIYHGYSAVLVSIGVSSLIIIVGSYITHGFNRTTSAAVLGMIATVVVTGLGAYYVVHAAHLSGYSTEEAVYLNFDTQGKINMVGLVFGGIMIGLLGVLYDIAIGQAVAVEELYRAGGTRVYSQAVRIGREHIGALVNTLAIAYVGAALPLLLLIQSSSANFLFTINSELFATEIIRILIGSIGLILGVPVTTFIASRMLSAQSVSPSSTQSHSHAH